MLQEQQSLRRRTTVAHLLDVRRVGCLSLWGHADGWIDGWMDGGSEIEESRQERMEK